VTTHELKTWPDKPEAAEQLGRALIRAARTRKKTKP
jgi:hypothetical protein